MSVLLRARHRLVHATRHAGQRRIRADYRRRREQPTGTRLDLFRLCRTGVVQVLIGNGPGRFTKGTHMHELLGQNPQGLATADFNHDGWLDVAVAYASGLRVLYGNGGTAFTARAVAGAALLNVVATGDFNADGWTDVAAARRRTAPSRSTVAAPRASRLRRRTDRQRRHGGSPRATWMPTARWTS